MATTRYSTATTYNSIGEFSSDSYFGNNPYFETPSIQDRPTRQNRNIKQTEKKKNKILMSKVISKNSMAISAGEKGKAIISIIFIGIVCIAIVLLSAYSADLKNGNNKLVKENGFIQSEVDGLNIKIGEASQIEHIEQVAFEKLGMVYPDPSKCIHVTEEDMPEESLAAIIKDGAYN
ncbi:MAG: hypothetical protein GX078_03015 [Clostridiales bacterium]|jgi:cell division protein FtsL|nr:hypothetical protein [Clostridiales bacterium]